MNFFMPIAAEPQVSLSAADTAASDRKQTENSGGNAFGIMLAELTGSMMALQTPAGQQNVNIETPSCGKAEIPDNNINILPCSTSADMQPTVMPDGSAEDKSVNIVRGPKLTGASAFRMFVGLDAGPVKGEAETTDQNGRQAEMPDSLMSSAQRDIKAVPEKALNEMQKIVAGGHEIRAKARNAQEPGDFILPSETKLTGAFAFRMFVGIDAGPVKGEAETTDQSGLQAEMPDSLMPSAQKDIKTVPEKALNEMQKIAAGILPQEAAEPIGLRNMPESAPGQNIGRKISAGGHEIRAKARNAQEPGDFILPSEAGPRLEEQPLFQTIRIPAREHVSFEPDKAGKETPARIPDLSHGKDEDVRTRPTETSAVRADERVERDSAGPAVVQGAARDDEQPGIQIAGASANNRIFDIKAGRPELQSAAIRPEALSASANADGARFIITRHDARSIELTLHPEGLGKLDIGLVVEKGVLHAQIQASHPAGKELVEKNISEIINALGQEGIMVGGFSVSLRNNGNEWGRQERDSYPDRPASEMSDSVQEIPHTAKIDNSAVSIFV